MKQKRNTYFDLLRGEFQVALKRFSDGAFLLGVHPGDDKPPNVEPDFYEVRVRGKDISDLGEGGGCSLMGNFLGRLF
jgi:hypothetical protein